MATRNTRGPRTARERAQDAARSAATMLEDLPPSHEAEEYLAPIAALLRFFFGSASRAREEAAQAAYVGLLANLSHWERLHPQLAARPGEATPALLTELKADAKEVDRRLANYVDAAASSAEAADDGLALAAKAQRLLSSAWGDCQDRQRELERRALSHV